MAVNEVVVVNSNEQISIVNNTTSQSQVEVVNTTPAASVVESLAGIQGVPGPANNLLLGTVTTSAPGAAAEVDITGSSPNQTINFTLPRGTTGPANVLTVAPVTTLYSGQAPTATITGTAPTQTLNLSLPKGAEILSGTAAPSGAAGSINDWYINTTTWEMFQKTAASTWTLRLNLRGATGPANVLSVGTVTALDPTATPTIDITGTSPSQVINFGIPESSQILQGTTVPAGGTGLVGDWYINTVTWDMYEKTAASTWTLRMNIRGAKGDKGDTGNTGPANQLSVGTVTTGAEGSSASAQITGTAPVQTINFTIPRGDTGATGPAPNLAVGTVTTGAAGSSAAATVTGTNPNYLINLTVPRGDKGEIGAQWYSGLDAPTSGQGDIGDYYLVTGITGTGDVYKKTDATTWTLEGNIRGLPGSGNVNSVNDILPDGNGQILLNSHIIRPAGVSDSGDDTTTGYWSRIATITLTSQYQDFAIKVSINSSETGADPNQGGFVAMNVRQNDPLGTAPAVRFDTYELRDMTPADLKYTVDATATESEVSFWIKSNRPYTKFTYFMVDQSNSVGLQALDFNQGEPRVASEPVGTTANGNANWHVFQKEQLPAIAINDTFVVNSEAEMLALTAQVGDTAVRQDTSTTYILKTEPATVLANWIPLVFNASNLTQGTISDDVLPTRLQQSSYASGELTDFNLATTNGWFTLYSPPGTPVANAPTSESGNWMVTVQAWDDSNVIQEAYRLQSSVNNSSSIHRRFRNGGVWSSWYKIVDSQPENDARYVQLTGNQTISGAKSFSSTLEVNDGTLRTLLNSNSLTFERAGATSYIDQNGNSGAIALRAKDSGGNYITAISLNSDAVSFSVPPRWSTAPSQNSDLANKSYVDTGLSGKANTAHNHDTAAITTGTFDIARIPTGTTSTTVALGNHLHTGVYEPVIAAGTTAQFRRGDNTWQNISGAMVDLSSAQTIGGAKTFTSTPTFNAGYESLTNTVVRPIPYSGNQALDGVRVTTQNNGGVYYWETRFGLASTSGGVPRAGIRTISRNSSNAVMFDIEPLTFDLGNGNATFLGTISGNGSGLTALSGSNISTGTVADARLSTNVTLNDAQQTFSGIKTFSANPDILNGAPALSISNSGFKNSGGSRVAGSIDFRSGGNTGERSGPVASIQGIDRYAGGSYIGDLAFYTQNAATLSERMRIFSTGNILIGGTTYREARLTVAAASNPSFPLTLGSGAGSGLQISNTDAAYGMHFGVVGDGRGYIQQMRSDGTATSYNLLLQPQGGNVGIGGTASSEKLEVTGNIKASGSVSSAGLTNTGDLTMVTNGTYVNLHRGAGYAEPTFSTRSTGTRIILHNSVAASAADYAIGIGTTSNMWFSVINTGAEFEWYGGTTRAMELSGNGNLKVTTDIAAPNYIGSLSSFNGILGSTAGNHVITRQHQNLSTGQTNNYYLTDMLVRRAAGTDWTQTDWMQGIAVDSSFNTPLTLRSWIRRDAQNQTIAFGSGATTYGTMGTSNLSWNFGINASGTIEGRKDLASTDWSTAGLSTANNAGHPSIAFHRPSVLAYQLRLNKDTSNFEFVNQAGNGTVGLVANNITAQGGVTAAATTNSLNTQRIVFTVASQARPTGTAYVEWVGPVEPTNAINGDTWVNTSV